MKSIDHHIQNQVDLFLFEEGSFAPINWLIRQGYLGYSDYQQWKKGEIEYLEDYFTKTCIELIAELKKVQDYADLQQLECIKHEYFSLNNQILHFSRTPAYNVVFTNIYEPAQNRVQMDLFFDSSQACNISDLIKAICEKSDDHIAELLLRLEQSNPEKHQQFIKLLSSEKEFLLKEGNHNNKINSLKILYPLAFELLGHYAQDFIIPLWQTISKEIADKPFVADDAETHLSYTAFKGLQWQKVLLSIEREQDWNSYPILLFRYAEASFKLNLEHQGIATWFELFNLCAKTAEQLITSTCHQVLHSDWQYFLELDPELEPLLFPAWMLINKPVLAKNTTIPKNSGNEIFCLIQQIIASSDAEINQALIQQRKKLKHLSPVLFIHYMKTTQT